MKTRDRIAKWYTRVTFILTGVFVILKIAEVIGWSWWWVTCPVWFNLLAAVALVIWAKIYLRK